MRSAPAATCRLIASGVTAIVRPDPELGFVAVNVWHGVGSMHDPQERSGLAHVTEHVLFGSADADAVTAHRGESANATTAFERTTYVATGRPDSLSQLLAQTAQRLESATQALTGAELVAHRRVVLEEIRQREEPARFGSGLRRSLRLLFGPEHPFGKPPSGRPEEVSAVSRDDVAAFIDRAYGTAPVIIAIVGSVESDHALRLAERHFAPLTGHYGAREAVGVRPAPGESHREDVQEGQPTGMLRFTFALPPEGDPLASAGEVTMALLAGAAWSALSPELVHEYRIFGASSQHVRCGSGAALGLVKISVPAGVDLDQLDQAVTDRWAQLARQGPAEGALAAATARRSKEYLAILSRARACAEELCLLQAWTGSAERFGDRLGSIHGVSDADVAMIAARFLAQPATVAFHAQQPQGTSWIE
ncbi:M16 family metallopeptidase [Streptomyces sp. 900105755]